MNTRRDEQDRIEVNPDILMGQPVIAGTRIPVYFNGESLIPCA